MIRSIGESGRVAYFTMEIALDSGMPTYCGGLGVLAGDTIRSFTDLGVPAVGVTLLYRKGYCRQKLDENGNQKDLPDEWKPQNFLKLLPPKVSVKVSGRRVKVRAWQKEVKGAKGFPVPVIFLDTNLKENDERAMEITSYLYGGRPYAGDPEYRLAQEIVLGIGGVRMLEKLGFTDIKKFHMNEGHSALLTLELLRKYNLDLRAVRRLCVFTTHTPVTGGHDRFPYSLVGKILGEFVPLSIIKKLSGRKLLNMTKLAISLSGYTNGVSKRHGELSRKMFSGYHIDSITNGIHSVTWTSESFRKIYDRYTPGWRADPFKLKHAIRIPKEDIWRAHLKEKKKLIDYINKVTNVGMSYKTFTMGFARRAIPYKRANLLFHDPDRLVRIAKNVGNFQVLFTGKAYPADKEGKELIREIFGHISRLKDEIKIAYLENYNLRQAELLASGVDLWLNNPRRPLEACGTSGMKAAHNGVPQLSVLDGWWIEGHLEGVTGWSIGPEPGRRVRNSDEEDAEDIYSKLENVIIPLFYENREKWVGVMRNAIALNASFFNTHRMVREYILNAYS